VSLRQRRGQKEGSVASLLPRRHRFSCSDLARRIFLFSWFSFLHVPKLGGAARPKRQASGSRTRWVMANAVSTAPTDSYCVC